MWSESSIMAPFALEKETQHIIDKTLFSNENRCSHLHRENIDKCNKVVTLSGKLTHKKKDEI